MKKLLICTLACLLCACDAPTPAILSTTVPGDTRDVVGPYTVQVVTRDVVSDDRVEVHVSLDGLAFIAMLKPPLRGGDPSLDVERVNYTTEMESIKVFGLGGDDQFAIDDTRAESLILRGYERQVVSHRQLPLVLAEWRKPRFEEFAPRTIDRRFVGIQASRRDFVQESVSGVAELPNQQDAGAKIVRLIEKRNDGGGAGVSDQLEFTRRPVGESNHVAVEVQDTARVDPT